MTRWSPDTCGCVIYLALPLSEFDWSNIAIEHVKAVTPCKFHAGMSTHEAFTQVYHGENKAKNQFLSHLKENVPDLAADAANEDCAFCDAYGVKGKLTFDKDRKLQYEPPADAPDHIKASAAVALEAVKVGEAEAVIG